jgi:hypothetical protein
MRFTVNIECTPEEARDFFGLPDVKSMQDAMMGEMQKQMQAGMQVFQANPILQPWLKLQMDSLQQFQSLFLNAPVANNSPAEKKRA